MDRHPPLPRRVAWFAPWTWNRRKSAAFLVLMFAGYVVAEAPTEYLILRRYGRTYEGSAAWQVHERLYWPMETSRGVSDTLTYFHILQERWLAKTFG